MKAEQAAAQHPRQDAATASAHGSGFPARTVDAVTPYTSVGADATSTPMKDHRPADRLALRRGCGSASAPSSAGSGSFKGVRGQGIGLAMMGWPCLVAPAHEANGSTANPCVSYGYPCLKTLCQMTHQCQAREQAGNSKIPPIPARKKPRVRSARSYSNAASSENAGTWCSRRGRRHQEQTPGLRGLALKAR